MVVTECYRLLPVTGHKVLPLFSPYGNNVVYNESYAVCCINNRSKLNGYRWHLDIGGNMLDGRLSICLCGRWDGRCAVPFWRDKLGILWQKVMFMADFVVNYLI